MAVAAIDAVISHMMFVAEWHRLVERHADIGGVGGPVNRGGRPTCATNQNHNPKEDDSGMDVRARREELGHEELKFLLCKNESRMQASWDACNRFLANVRNRPMLRDNCLARCNAGLRRGTQDFF